MTTVNAIECPECEDIIYSRARHDFRSCSCGKCHIDGGFDYMKVAAEPELFNKIKEHKIEVDATRSELYDDWNKRIDKYGRIPCG